MNDEGLFQKSVRHNGRTAALVIMFMAAINLGSIWVASRDRHSLEQARLTIEAQATTVKNMVHECRQMDKNYNEVISEQASDTTYYWILAKTLSESAPAEQMVKARAAAKQATGGLHSNLVSPEMLTGNAPPPKDAYVSEPE